MDRTGNLLGLVQTHLCRSELAYIAYLNSGKLFLYAKILKKSNDRLLNFLTKNTHLLPIECMNYSLALIFHLDVWTTIWDDYVYCNKPDLNSIFVFESVVKFPSKEVTLLMDYYKANYIDSLI